jgi:hypothetical protein
MKKSGRISGSRFGMSGRPLTGICKICGTKIYQGASYCQEHRPGYSKYKDSNKSKGVERENPITGARANLREGQGNKGLVENCGKVLGASDLSLPRGQSRAPINSHDSTKTGFMISEPLPVATETQHSEP